MVRLINERGPPIGHDAITDILVDDPSVGPNRFRHDGKVAVHDLDETLRGHAFAQARESLEVAEQNRHHPALTLRCCQVRAIDQPFDDAGIDIFAECFADALVVAQLADHPVECAGQLPNFVARCHIDGLIELACLDGSRPLKRLPDRANDATADKVGENQPDDRDKQRPAAEVRTASVCSDLIVATAP